MAFTLVLLERYSLHETPPSFVLYTEWPGSGSEPDNENYIKFTTLAVSAVYLEKTPEEAGVTASITKVK